MSSREPSKADVLIDADRAEQVKKRVSARQRAAVKAVLLSASQHPDIDALVDAVCIAHETAEDDLDRYIVVTRQAGTNTVFAFGTYGSRDTAMGVIESGLLGWGEGVRAMVLPLGRAPKAPRKKKEK